MAEGRVPLNPGNLLSSVGMWTVTQTSWVSWEFCAFVQVKHFTDILTVL